eukprot:1507793-Pyramimonas_sp.AAC.1
MLRALSPGMPLVLRPGMLLALVFETPEAPDALPSPPPPSHDLRLTWLPTRRRPKDDDNDRLLPTRPAAALRDSILEL